MHYTVSKEAFESLTLALKHLDRVETDASAFVNDIRDAQRAVYDAKRVVIDAAVDLLSHAQKVM